MLKNKYNYSYKGIKLLFKKAINRFFTIFYDKFITNSASATRIEQLQRYFLKKVLKTFSLLLLLASQKSTNEVWHY